jgi:hypothetical protein
VIYIYPVEYCSATKKESSQVWWFKPVILATQKVRIGRNAVHGQPQGKVHKTSSKLKVWLSSQLHREAQIGGLWSGPAWHKVRPYLKNNQCKKGWWHGSRVKQVQGPEFNPIPPKKGRKEGRKERKKEGGREEGRKEERKKRRKEEGNEGNKGRKGGRDGGREEGRKEGKKEGKGMKY